jgi:hypothetical protein
MLLALSTARSIRLAAREIEASFAEARRRLEVEGAPEKHSGRSISPIV